jgi:plastocyanin
LLALAFGFTAGGCSNGEVPRDVVELESGQVQLPSGAHRHDVRLQGVGALDEVTPNEIDASPGDAVAFIAADGITHSISFLGERLDAAQIAFLDSTGQRRGPPLLREGASWIVSLADAPAGEYAFACALHGGHGVIRVTAPR